MKYKITGIHTEKQIDSESSYSEETFQLSKINLFTGDASSGKSTYMFLIHLFSNAFQGLTCIQDFFKLSIQYDINDALFHLLRNKLKKKCTLILEVETELFFDKFELQLEIETGYNTIYFNTIHLFTAENREHIGTFSSGIEYNFNLKILNKLYTENVQFYNYLEARFAFFNTEHPNHEFAPHLFNAYLSDWENHFKTEDAERLERITQFLTFKHQKYKAEQKKMEFLSRPTESTIDDQIVASEYTQVPFLRNSLHLTKGQLTSSVKRFTNEDILDSNKADFWDAFIQKSAYKEIYSALLTDDDFKESGFNFLSFLDEIQEKLQLYWCTSPKNFELDFSQYFHEHYYDEDENEFIRMRKILDKILQKLNFPLIYEDGVIYGNIASIELIREIVYCYLMHCEALIKGTFFYLNDSIKEVFKETLPTSHYNPHDLQVKRIHDLAEDSTVFSSFLNRWSSYSKKERLIFEEKVNVLIRFFQIGDTISLQIVNEVGFIYLIDGTSKLKLQEIGRTNLYVLSLILYLVKKQTEEKFAKITPSRVVLEDPELGLSPFHEERLVELIYLISHQNNVQFIIETKSQHLALKFHKHESSTHLSSYLFTRDRESKLLTIEKLK